MAADVVTPFDRGLEPQRKPFKAEARVKRRRLYFITRIGRAQTSDVKLDAAIDYFRAMAADHKVDKGEVVNQSDRLTHLLIAAADQLAKTIRRSR